jgi:hypothetical protein
MAGILLLLWGSLLYSRLLAQTALPFTPLPLDDMGGFKPAAANWKVVGDAIADRAKDQSLQSSSGKGVLLNVPNDKNKDNLFTGFEHGNIELELEFMMAKGSNSGIYLQGRYEVQLFDSWGKKNTLYSDCGGIYERWNDALPEGQKGYEGHPPRVNVSRAPGLWQTMKIVFQAPVFDKNGKKVTPARFVKVIHNGVIVHENVEVTGPTRAAAFQDEKPFGPLMLQGDHGPVAFRNIRYKRYDQPFVELTDVEYQYSEGKFKTIAEAVAAPVKKQGKPDGKTAIIESNNDFGLRLTGNVQVPAKGNYLFELKSMGGVLLTIDNKEVIRYDGFHYTDEWARGQVALDAGKHTFSILYFRSKDPWLRPVLSVYVEGPGVAREQLPLPTALPAPEYVEPIYVQAPEVRMLRSFMWHQGRKKTLAISVGEPGNVHYALDLQQGNLMYIWKGGFLDVTEMWHDRGEPQLAKPMGSVIELSGEPALAALSSKDAAWPDSADASFQYKGYSVDAQGRPTFRYLMQGTTVQDQLLPGDDNRLLTRQLQLKNNGQTTGTLYCLLASGNRITQVSDGVYAINDKAYYLELEGAKEAKPVIRQSKNRQELLVPVSWKDGQSAIRYRMIW